MAIDESVPWQRQKVEKAFMAKLRKGVTVKSLIAQRLAKDGKLMDVWMPVIMLKDDTGEPIEITTTERDLAWLPSVRSPATK